MWSRQASIRRFDATAPGGAATPASRTMQVALLAATMPSVGVPNRRTTCVAASSWWREPVVRVSWSPQPRHPWRARTVRHLSLLHNDCYRDGWLCLNTRSVDIRATAPKEQKHTVHAYDVTPPALTPTLTPAPAPTSTPAAPAPPSTPATPAVVTGLPRPTAGSDAQGCCACRACTNASGGGARMLCVQDGAVGSRWVCTVSIVIAVFHTTRYRRFGPLCGPPNKSTTHSPNTLCEHTQGRSTCHGIFLSREWRWHIIIIVTMLRHAVDARSNFFPHLIRIGKWSGGCLVRLTTEIQGKVHVRRLIACVENLQSTKHICEPRIGNEHPPSLCVAHTQLNHQHHLLATDTTHLERP